MKPRTCRTAYKLFNADALHSTRCDDFYLYPPPGKTQNGKSKEKTNGKGNEKTNGGSREENRMENVEERQMEKMKKRQMEK